MTTTITRVKPSWAFQPSPVITFKPWLHFQSHGSFPLKKSPCSSPQCLMFSYDLDSRDHLALPQLYWERAMAPHSSTLARKIPWAEKPGRLQSMGWLRVRHVWAIWLSLFTFMHRRRKWQPTHGWSHLISPVLFLFLWKTLINTGRTLGYQIPPNWQMFTTLKLLIILNIFLSISITHLIEELWIE